MSELTNIDHTFVICANGENPYLRDCIESLLRQTVSSTVKIAASTPNEHIKILAEEYNISLFINPEQSGLASDWNFAYAQATTSLVTLVHQDDIYEPEYLNCVLKYLKDAKEPLIAFTDYYEIRDGNKVYANTLLRIKRIMNFPLRFEYIRSSVFLRRRILSLGCTIPCPSVTFFRENIPFPLFNTSYKNSCDYLAWEEISRLKGSFVYCPAKLVGHRIHEESLTSENIRTNTRSDEDKKILAIFWPKPIAGLIFMLYKLGQRSNRLE